MGSFKLAQVRIYKSNMKFGFFQFSPNKLKGQFDRTKTITYLAVVETGTSVNRANIKHTLCYFLTSAVGFNSRLV